MSDQEINLKFVGEVEKHEVLYNYKLAGYSRKEVTEKAWQEVAAEVNMTGMKQKLFFKLIEIKIFFTSNL